MKCLKCTKEAGFLLPANPMDITSGWKCIKCKSEKSAEEIEIYIHECQKKIEHTPEDDIENLEHLLQEFKTKCHPSHQIGIRILKSKLFCLIIGMYVFTYFAVSSVERILASAYGNVQGYKYNQLSNERLNAQIDFYQNYLDLVNRINPGYSSVSVFIIFFQTGINVY